MTQICCLVRPSMAVAQKAEEFAPGLGAYILKLVQIWLLHEFDAEGSKNNARMLAAAAATIPEVMVSTSRASPRIVRSPNEHTLVRARKRTALKNLENNEGTVPRHSTFRTSSTFC